MADAASEALEFAKDHTRGNRLIHGYFDVDRDGKDHTKEDWVNRIAR